MDQKWNTVNGFSLSEIKARGIFFFFSFGHDSAAFELAHPELLMHPALYIPSSPKNLQVPEPSVEIIFLCTSSSPVAKGEWGLQSVHHRLSLPLLPVGDSSSFSCSPNLAVQTQYTQRHKALQQHHPNH